MLTGALRSLFALVKPIRFEGQRKFHGPSSAASKVEDIARARTNYNATVREYTRQRSSLQHHRGHLQFYEEGPLRAARKKDKGQLFRQ